MEELYTLIWDVQHGNAMYLRTPGNHHIVIDLGVGSYIGETSKTFSPLAHLKKRYGIKSLDAVVVSHPHTDHIDDIHNLMKLNPKVFVRPTHIQEEYIRSGNRSKDQRLIDKYLQIDRAYPPVRGPLTFGKVKLDFFFPTTCSQGNLNNQSIVTIVSFRGEKIIIPGDNDSCSWNELFQNPRFIRKIKGYGVLIAAHHGRKSGCYAPLFDYFTPYICIISDGSVCETSRTQFYSSRAKGWPVVSKVNGKEKPRHCLTTRSDGFIEVRFSNDGKANYLEISKEA